MSYGIGVVTRRRVLSPNESRFSLTQAVIPPYVGPGDVQSGGLTYLGLRAYSSASIGLSVIRLRRDSDQAESDFATVTGGGLDPSIAAWKVAAGAANLFVVSLYDQTPGQANGVTQGTAANQPGFTLGGLGALPIMTFNGSQGLSRGAWAGSPPEFAMHSYFRRAFAGGTLATNFLDQYVNLAGNLVSWTIDVKKPYTGAGANFVCQIVIGGFAISGGITYPTVIIQTIDLKTAGLRTITATGVTGSVGADSLAAIPFWISGRHWVIAGITPSFIPDGGDNAGNTPYFVMTAQTDQGIGFGSITLNTTISGVQTIADTVTMAGQGLL